jgi:hypothetical protein
MGRGHLEDLYVDGDNIKMYLRGMMNSTGIG